VIAMAVPYIPVPPHHDCSPWDWSPLNDVFIQAAKFLGSGNFAVFRLNGHLDKREIRSAIQRTARDGSYNEFVELEPALWGHYWSLVSSGLPNEPPQMRFYDRTPSFPPDRSVMDPDELPPPGVSVPPCCSLAVKADTFLFLSRVDVERVIFNKSAEVAPAPKEEKINDEPPLDTITRFTNLARDMKRDGQITLEMKKTKLAFAKALNAKLGRPRADRYISGQLEAWGLWPIDKIKI
jgi:hypothetical protein